MRKFLIILFLLPVSLYAASPDCKKQISTDIAKKYLTSLQGRYKNLKTFSADFRQKSYISALQVSEESQGNIIIDLLHTSLKWHYLAPEEQIYLIKDKRFSHYRPLDLEVTIRNIEDGFLGELPIGFLLGMGSLQNDFDLISSCEQQDGNIALFLKAKIKENSEPNFQTLSLVIGGNNAKLTGLEVRDLSDNITGMYFDNVEYDKEMSAEAFDISYPENTFVNDISESENE